MEFELVQPQLLCVANNDIRHYGIMQSPSTCMTSLLGSSQHAEGPWLPEPGFWESAGAAERGRRSLSGVHGSGESWERDCTRSLSAHLPIQQLYWAVCSVLGGAQLQKGTNYSVPVVNELEVWNVRKVGNLAMILKLPTMQCWREHLTQPQTPSVYKAVHFLKFFISHGVTFQPLWASWPWLEPRIFSLMASLSFSFLWFFVSPLLSFPVPLCPFSRVLNPS